MSFDYRCKNNRNTYLLYLSRYFRYYVLDTLSTIIYKEKKNYSYIYTVAKYKTNGFSMI